MPWLVKDGGSRQFVGNEYVDGALGNGWRLADGETVTVSDQGVAPVNVDAEGLARARDMRLATPDTQEERAGRGQEAFLEERYGGFQARNLVESGLSGATLGLSDIIAAGIDPVGTRERRERGVGTTAAGIAGAVIPALLMGGTGAAGALARLTPAGMATRAGVAVGKRAGLVMGFASEGAMYGAGQGVSNVALSDDPVNAELLMGEIGGNAIYGAALGAGLGVLAKASSEVLGKMRTLTRDAAHARGTAVAERALGTGSRDVPLNSITEHMDLMPSPPPGARAGLQMRESLSGVDRVAAEAERMADDLLRTTRRGDDVLKAARAEYRAARDPFNNLVGDRTDDALEAALGKRWFPDAAAKYENKALALHREVMGLPAAEGGFKVLSGSGIEDLGVAARTAHDAAKKPGFAMGVDLAKADVPVDLPGAANMGQFDLLNGTRTGSELLPGVVQPRGSARILDKALSHAPAAITILGAALGGPVGAGLAMLGQGMRTVGAVNTLSKLLGSARLSADALITATMAVGKKAARAAIPASTQILSDASFGETKTPRDTRTRLGAFHARQAELLDFAADPVAGRARVNTRLMPLRVTDDKLAQQVEDLAVRRNEYLLTTMPKSPGVGNTLQGRDRWQPSDREVQKFSRAIWMTEKPTNVLVALRSGSLTRADVEAVKAVYPKSYEQVRVALVFMAPEMKKEIPYDMRVQLSTFFDVPVDTAMRPERIAQSQAMWAEDKDTSAQDQAPGSPTAARTGRRGGMSSVNSKKQQLTKGQELAAR